MANKGKAKKGDSHKEGAELGMMTRLRSSAEDEEMISGSQSYILGDVGDMSRLALDPRYNKRDESELTETASTISDAPTVAMAHAGQPSQADMFNLMVKTMEQNTQLIQYMRDDRRMERREDWDRQRERDAERDRLTALNRLWLVPMQSLQTNTLKYQNYKYHKQCI